MERRSKANKGTGYIRTQRVRYMSDNKPERPMLPLCPTHRDKVRGQSCRQCMIEALFKLVDAAIDELDPDMLKVDIVLLRERLIQRRSALAE